MNRKKFISTVAGATATAVVGAGTIIGNSTPNPKNSTSSIALPNHKVKRGVSLYSYQRAIMEKGMTLEDCLEELSDIGAYGVEFMTQSMCCEYPNVSNKWVDNWWNMMDKYGTRPDCLTYFNDTYRRLKGRQTDDENVEFMSRDLQIAKRLGLMKVRGKPPQYIIDRMIPIAEKLGIWFGQELHSPVALNSKVVELGFEQAQKYPHVIGFVPDMGIFNKYPRPLTRELQIRAGTLTRDIALYIEDSYRKGMDKVEVASKVKGMKPKPGDTNYIDRVYNAGASCQNPKDLIPLLPYCKHIHAKCHEMTKGNEFNDTEMLYNEVVPILMEHGFDGYIATEFEGQRIGTLEDVDEIEEVRRQHVMLKGMLGV